MKMKKVMMLLFMAVMILGCSSSDGGSGPTVGGPTGGDGGNGGDGGDGNGGGNTTLYLKDHTNFPIGNIVSAAKLASSSSDNTQMKTILLNEYNSITAENDMKMANMFPSQGNYDFSDGDAIVAYAKANGLRVHGHALIWHPTYAIPDWLENFSGTDEEFEAIIEDYVKTTVEHFAQEKDSNGNSIVSGWDVVNEYIDDGSGIRSTLFTQRMGSDYIKKIFQWAREGDPDVKLFYNDYNVVIQSKRQAIINMVNDFKANNIPIDGIGMQMHLNYEWPSSSSISDAITDVVNTGLLVHVSELDIAINPNPNNTISSLNNERAQAQANQYQNVAYHYGAIVPAAQQYGITLWGFRDIDSWIYNNSGGNDWPLLYDASFNKKPAYDGFTDGLKGIPN